MKTAILMYGTIVYTIFLGVFLYLIGFVANVLVPKGINDGIEGPMSTAIIINVSLIMLFAVQHTIMARPRFKRWFTKVVPQSAERSTFVLITAAILMLMFWQWRPMTGIAWDIENPYARILMYSLSGFGWGLALLSTFLINHFDLFGLRQVVLQFFGKEYNPVPTKVVSLYRMVRNPLMLGFIIAFWATPTMTMGHLLFAITYTSYILVGIQFEERTLSNELGEVYRAYRKRTPMLIPTLTLGERSIEHHSDAMPSKGN